MVMSEDEKLTAYHEGGHAIVALNEKASDPIHKATIIPRGRALGIRGFQKEINCLFQEKKCTLISLLLWEGELPKKN